MEVKSVEGINRILERIAHNNEYGELVIKFSAGEITEAKKTNVYKPDDLMYGFKKIIKVKAEIIN